MEAAAKVISAIASLAWPVVIGVVLYKLYEPIRALVQSANKRKFTVKVAGNELTMEEATEQQRAMTGDIQARLAALEHRLPVIADAVQKAGAPRGMDGKLILWVDDNPKNNSYLTASLEEQGARVEIALSTTEAISKFNAKRYDVVLSDMGRPEGDRAGIDLTKKLKALKPDTPVLIYCGAWAAHHLRAEALEAGATEITSSGVALLSALTSGTS